VANAGATSEVTAHVTQAATTLDTLFQRILARQPEALALLDPLNKQRVTGHTPGRLTYAEADRAIWALSTHFVESGLPPNSVIAIQLPNTIEFVLTVLAAHRAGLVVAVLPLLWRHAELVAALNRTSARAVVTMSSIDGINYSDLAMNAAAEASIQHVCGFGRDLPEGMASLDDVLASEPDQVRSVVQDGREAAVISFDVTSEGVQPILRSHLSLIAGGLAISLESDVRPGAVVMSAFAPMSFAGLASSLVVWLLSGGTLVLHHPFDDEVLEEQINAHSCDVLVAPAQFALQLGKVDLTERLPSLRNVIGLWRAPEQITSSEAWAASDALMTDIYLFGEAGLLGATRGPDGLPLPIMPGPRGTPHNEGSSITGDVLLTPKGTLGLRGPMVPVTAYVPPLSPRDYVDTGYVARLDDSTGAICITAPPAGILAVGGYRFLSNDLREWARRLGPDALLTALPDRVSGHRLVGHARDNTRAREALSEQGLNPLMVEAFLDRTNLI